jgi:hypothetical protein
MCCRAGVNLWQAAATFILAEFGKRSYRLCKESTEGVQNMQGRIWISALALAVSFALQSTASNAEPIGTTTRVKPDARVNSQPLAPGNEVNANDTVRTGNVGTADFRFVDSSNLKVGPASTVRLDRFVYDPNRGSASVAIEASRGVFRFTTGSQNQGYKVKTPYGTLGVRG